MTEEKRVSKAPKAYKETKTKEKEWNANHPQDSCRPSD